MEDTKKENTESEETFSTVSSFSGVDSVVPIAHDKIDVFFYPSIIPAEEATYYIAYDNLEVAITVPGSVLVQDYRGLLRYTLDRLDIDTVYNISVEVQDKETLQVSNSKITKSTKTFSNKTVDFYGVGKLTNSPGASGLNSIVVEWARALQTGSDFVPDEGDPVEYVVTLIDSNQLTPGDMNNEAFGEPRRIVQRIAKDKRKVTINGLQPNTKYHVQVRSIHQGFRDFGADINYKLEQNTVYKTISTLSNQAGGLSFNSEGLSLAVAGASGTSVTASWEHAAGAFDHYRLVYAKQGDATIEGYSVDSDCSGAQSSDANIFCKKIPFSSNTTTVAELNPNDTYDFMVHVCQDVECASASNAASSVRSILLSPQLASFQGITSIEQPRSQYSLDTIHLLFDPPDFSTGTLDGLIVEYKSSPAVFLNDPSSEDETPLEVLDFDPRSASEISVVGISAFSEENYCFSVLPYTNDSEGRPVVSRENEVTRCITPRVVPPTTEDFIGATGCTVTGSIASVDWVLPQAGVYAEFEVFLKAGATGFNYADAIGGDPNYIKKISGESDTSNFFSALADGSYQVGVLSHIKLNGEDYRSDFNDGVQTCVVGD